MKQFTNVEEYLELIAGYRDVVSGLRNPMVFYFSPIISLARYDTSVLDSMATATISGKALTERQGELAIKIIVKYKKQLSQKLIDVTPIEENPVFRVKPRQMDYRKSLYIKDDKILAKFPYDTKLIESIRSFKKDSQGECEFNIADKVWKFGMTEYNLNWTHTIASANGFEIDAEINQLMEKMSDTEKTPYAIELYVDGDHLNITNCPEGLREYITDKLGGFGLANLEKLVDNSGELGYTIRPDLASALTTQYGKFFVKIAQVKEAKLQQVTQERFTDLMKYALNVKRGPVVIYEPSHSGALLNMLLAADLGVHIQMLHIKGKQHNIQIDPDAQIIYTVSTIKHMEYIPMLVSAGGMIYGSDKQIMFQHAGKVIYLTPDVYRGTAENPKPTVENLDI
jgi:uncharacterized protein YgfB (UPF0149 family)